MEKKFCIKVYVIRQYGFIEKMVAVCDKEILGKKFEEGKKQIYVDPNFYFDREVNEKELLEELEGATIINAVGNDVVSFLEELGLIGRGGIIEICGIKHAQIVVMC